MAKEPYGQQEYTLSVRLFLRFHGMMNITTTKGDIVISYEDIERLRKEKNPLRIIAQRGCQEKFLATNADITIFGGNRGGGKGEPYSAPIITPFGIRRMGDLKVGDIITASDGGMQKVICITELGNREVYRLNFSDGTSVCCTTDHIWKIKRTNYKHKARYVNGTGQEEDWRLWTFGMIKEFLDKQAGKSVTRCKNNLLVPMCKPVKFTRGIGRGYAPVTDPYIIGIILGDGCVTESQMRSCTASVTTNDFEIIQNIQNCGLFHCREYKKTSANASDYYYKDDSLKQDLIKIGIAGKNAKEKSIPDFYKYAPVEARFSLVQGLMDTDGTVDARGHCAFTTISKTLAEDMAFVLRSLGAYVTITEKERSYKDQNGNEIRCNNSFELYIKIEHSERLFRLSRKKARCKPFNGGVSDVTKRITGYEFAGYDKCRCIVVSSPDALYLTDDFTVTHNSWALLMEALKDIKDKNANMVILRNEKPDLAGLVDKSVKLFEPFGKYNKSINDMTWNFDKGGKLLFSYFGDSLSDFKIRFQGKEYNYIGVDEITHMPYDKFKYLITCNRNAYGIRNRFYGTCNPDPDSWVRHYIDWWIGPDGLPIPERDGVLRYCFMDGDDFNTIYWGDTPEEVYNQCSGIIDSLWKEEYGRLGFNKITMFVKSVTFIRGKLEENIALISSDPNYVANLAQQGEEQRARDLEGNWNFKAAGDDAIKMEHMERMFTNSFQTRDGRRWASCDIAFGRGDNLVLVLWIGMHIQDICVIQANAKEAESIVRMKLREWGVRDPNFVYDLNGLGQAFRGFFPYAVGFNNQGAPIPTCSAEKDSIKYLYANLKSQCAYMLIEDFRNGRISINPDLLDRKYSGNGYANVPLRSILMKERKAIRDAGSEKGFCIIKKDIMIKYVGHSPDFMEAILYREYFNIKVQLGKPKFTLRYVSHY